MAERDAGRFVRAGIIRTAMGQDGRHPFQDFVTHRGRRVRARDTTDSTHTWHSLSGNHLRFSEGLASNHPRRCNRGFSLDAHGGRGQQATQASDFSTTAMNAGVGCPMVGGCNPVGG